MKVIITVSLAIMAMLILWTNNNCLLTEAAPSPNPAGFFEKLFGFSSYNGGGGYYNGGGGYNSGYSSGRGYSGGGGGNRRQKQGRSYSDICRVVTIDAYARPGGRVYPAQPFCPYN